GCQLSRCGGAAGQSAPAVRHDDPVATAHCLLAQSSVAEIWHAHATQHPAGSAGSGDRHRARGPGANLLAASVSFDRGHATAAGHREDEGATIGTGARIDYCFVSAVLAPRVKSARIDAAAVGSDHQPLWVEMDL